MAWQFTASNQVIAVPYAAALNIRTNISAEVIFNCTAADTGANQHILNRRVSGGIQYQLYIQNATGYLILYINQGFGVDKQYQYSTSIVGAPHQVGFTFDTGTLKVFLDGVDITSSMSKSPDDAMTTLEDNTVDALRVGGIESSGFYFKGKIKRTLLYNTDVLTEAEFSELWGGGTFTDPLTNHGAYTSSGDLVMALLMKPGDSTASNGVIDSSGNGHNGSTVNDPTFVDWP